MSSASWNFSIFKLLTLDFVGQVAIRNGTKNRGITRHSLRSMPEMNHSRLNGHSA